MGLPATKLPVLEQFISFQGEGMNVGMPYYFIRVGGCPLRCNFCDSEYTWKVDKDSIVDVDDVIDAAAASCKFHGIDWVSITGGEPLLYPEQLLKIIGELGVHGIKVHIETSGRYYNAHVHLACSLYSVDAKTPCTGEKIDGGALGLQYMRAGDQVKCLIHTGHDLDFANVVNQVLDGRCTMVLQPFNVEIPTESTKNMRQEMADQVPVDISTERVRRGMLVSYANLVKMYYARCGNGEPWQKVILTPQLHVLTYGNEPGR